MDSNISIRIDKETKQKYFELAKKKKSKVSTMLKEHILRTIKRNKIKKINFNKLSDDDIMMYCSVKMCKFQNTDYNKEDIIKMLTSDFKEGKEWQDAKKRLEFIYDNYID
jgi:hypothetical protein